MTTEALKATINDLVQDGKGILAADESLPTITKRFDKVNVESTENNRRDYRSLLFTTEGLSQFVSGVILFEETLGQSTNDGTPLPEVLSRQGIVPGIKVDKGLIPLTDGSDEKMTQGLDGLAERLAQYKQRGARFAKWRAVFSISPTTPSRLAIDTNAEDLARYAAICQENGIVPIVEPEILMDGDHGIERCANVTEEVLHTVFHFLHKHKVALEYMILKPNMVLPGADHQPKADPMTVANTTLQVFKREVPDAVPSINFLSGGQSAVEATANLHAMNALAPQKAWQLSFSYGRALQDPALTTWAGNTDNVQAAQNALFKRAKLNGAATRGEYTDSMESDF